MHNQNFCGKINIIKNFCQTNIIQNICQTNIIKNFYQINIDSKIGNPSHDESMIKNEEYDKILS